MNLPNVNYMLDMVDWDRVCALMMKKVVGLENGVEPNLEKNIAIF